MTSDVRWPFSRLDVVSLIPVELDPPPVAGGVGMPEEAEGEVTPLPGGGRDLRRMVLQSGPGVGGHPGWCAGPAPFAVRRLVLDDGRYAPFADSASAHERSSLASSIVRERLYAPSRRWHRAGREDDQLLAWAATHSVEARAEPRVLALELLRLDPLEDAPGGLLMIHARPSTDLAGTIAALRLLTLGAPSSRPWINHLLRGVGRVAGSHLRPYHLCLARPDRNLPAYDDAMDGAGWSRAEQWLWLLATLQDAEQYPVTENNAEQLRRATLTLSRDWQCAVMRTGTAFLTRPLEDDWQPDPRTGRFSLAFLAETAPLLVRSLYSDAIALSVVKGIMLLHFANRLAALGDPVAGPDALARLEGDFTRFRNTLWWDDTGLSGHATMLLRAYGATYGQHALFDRLVADFTDYSQKVERVELQRSNEISLGTNALIGLVTCFGIPLGVLQVFGVGSTAVWIIVGVYGWARRSPCRRLHHRPQSTEAVARSAGTGRRCPRRLVVLLDRADRGPARYPRSADRSRLHALASRWQSRVSAHRHRARPIRIRRCLCVATMSPPHRQGPQSAISGAKPAASRAPLRRRGRPACRPQTPADR